ncbi:NUDIX domain-containing protein [Actinomadura sp. 7K507]|uniref:NUDIX hydrolase n=1 Tax=Actinomadura sp. 7K507 TaxID=2530365 RepID=UPI00104DF609|nr:NUDIX domain-containing protein [Actinomadura sp. 7K507]TDC95681.1 NUDIX hydrolase [Actinomadura sp. 7K507]
MPDSGTRPAADVIRAAGALLWRDGPEFALIHRPRYDDWSFPKGKVDRGEHMLRAAVREIEEETGIVARLGRRLPTITYPIGERTKLVDYWAARPAAADAFTANDFTPNDEVDEVRWLPAEEAEAKLSYQHDIDMLQEFLRGPLDTTPLVILRHASAGEKEDWHDADELRPLDAAGRAEAADLACLLRAYGPARLISSATARCLDTVLPYSRRTGTSIVTDPAFTVGDTGPDMAVERLLTLVEDGVPTIVCTHGEVVSELVEGLCKEMGEKVPDDPSLRKSEFWAAHLAGGSMPALERHSPKTTARGSATT